MAIATGTALMIGGMAASAAGKAVAAKKQSTAAKKAAEEQAKGAEASSGYMQQGMNQLGQLYSPYINSGSNAMGTLGRLVSAPPGARFAAPQVPNAMPQQPQQQPQQAMPRGGQYSAPQQGGPGFGPYGQYGGGGQMQTQDGRPMRGPFMMAAGGDYMVNEPTMFIAGEAGPERASFGGANGSRDFAAAGSPGLGSNAGAFVQSRGGGWVPSNHPDAMPQMDRQPGPMMDGPGPIARQPGPMMDGPGPAAPQPGPVMQAEMPLAAMPPAAMPDAFPQQLNDYASGNRGGAYEVPEPGEPGYGGGNMADYANTGAAGNLSDYAGPTPQVEPYWNSEGPGGMTGNAEDPNWARLQVDPNYQPQGELGGGGALKTWGNYNPGYQGGAKGWGAMGGGPLSSAAGAMAGATGGALGALGGGGRSVGGALGGAIGGMFGFGGGGNKSGADWLSLMKNKKGLAAKPNLGGTFAQMGSPSGQMIGR